MAGNDDFILEVVRNEAVHCLRLSLKGPDDVQDSVDVHVLPISSLEAFPSGIWLEWDFMLVEEIFREDGAAATCVT